MHKQIDLTGNTSIYKCVTNYIFALLFAVIIIHPASLLFSGLYLMQFALVTSLFVIEYIFKLLNKMKLLRIAIGNTGLKFVKYGDKDRNIKHYNLNIKLAKIDVLTAANSVARYVGFLSAILIYHLISTI